MRPGEYLLCLLAVLATSLPTQGMVFATQMEGGLQAVTCTGKDFNFLIIMSMQQKSEPDLSITLLLRDPVVPLGGKTLTKHGTPPSLPRISRPLIYDTLRKKWQKCTCVWHPLGV
jgi:hypothetical protein